MHGLTYAELAVEHDRAKAEIERLRAALEKIADPAYGGPLKEVASKALSEIREE
jgi:hypothetical protein